MSRKIIYCFALVALFALLTAGGCGSSSDDDNGSTPTASSTGSPIGRTVNLSENSGDSDNDGKPDFLDFDGIPITYRNNLYDASVEAAKTFNAAATVEDLSVPFIIKFDSLRNPDDPDKFMVELTAGKRYTVEFSKNFSEFLGARLPDVKLRDADDNEISEDVAISAFPVTSPAIICYTFTPKTTGIHTIEVCAANFTESNTDGFLFVYEELGSSEFGHYANFKAADDLTLTTAQVVHMRKSFVEANPDFIENAYGEDSSSSGRNSSGTPLDYSGADEYLGIVRGNAGIYDNDDEDDEDTLSGRNAYVARTQIDNTVYGVPYDSEYQLGAGFMATTNLQGFQDSALESFTIDAPTAKTGITKFTSTFISSAEDYEHKMGKNFSLSLSKNALGGSASVQSSSNLKFGLTSTTLVIHYEEMETDYRYLPNASYVLTQDARDILSENGSNIFREEYGDYFVAGYQYGGMYEATITITTDTMEKLETVKTEIGAQLKSLSGDLGTSGSASFSSTSQETLKKYNARISVEVRTIGAGNVSPVSLDIPNSQDISAMSAVADSLMNFRNDLAKSFSPNTYAPVNVMLKRYRSLPGMIRSVDAYIPVPATHSAKIMTLNRELANLRGYYNVIAGAAANEIDQSTKQGYTRRFDAIMNPVLAARNAFYAQENADSMDQTINAAIALDADLKAIGDRFTFYRMLMDAQNKETDYKTEDITAKPFGTNGGSIGYSSFGVSAAVTEDIKAGKYSQTKHTSVLNIGWDEWNPSYDAGENYVFCWFNVLAYSENDNNRQVQNPPAVGKRRVTFYFQAGYDRDANWTIRKQSIRMTRDNYPFSGLQQ